MSQGPDLCGMPCPLGCNSGEMRCYRPQPSNLAPPQSRFFPDPPAPPLEISGTAYLDTQTCQIQDDAGPAYQGRYLATVANQDLGPRICVIGVSALHLLPAARLLVYSSVDLPSPNAAAILSQAEVRIEGTLDARGCHMDRKAGFAAGPGGYWGAHGLQDSEVPCGGNDGSDRQGLWPGGGGGAFASAGGAGGSPTPGSPGGGGGSPVEGTAALSPLRGGCGGGLAAQDKSPGEGGGGGGAVQIVAATLIQVEGSGLIDVSGCGGRAQGATFGGCGGGAGGGILLEAQELSGDGPVAGGGGGGAGGAVDGTQGDGNGGGAGGNPADGPPGGQGAGTRLTLQIAMGAGDSGQDGGQTKVLGGGGGGGLGRVRVNVVTASSFTGKLIGSASTDMPAVE